MELIVHMTIGEVSKKFGMTADTIRYYERIGLLPYIPRQKNGIRDFDEEACKWVSFIKCMRGAGVQIEALIEYVTLMKNGDDPQRRKEILVQQRAKLLDRLKQLQDTIERLDFKIEHYNELILGAKK